MKPYFSHDEGARNDPKLVEGRAGSAYVRKCLAKRDNGVCASCGTDTIAQKLALEAYSRQQHLADLAAAIVNRIQDLTPKQWGFINEQRALRDAAWCAEIGISKTQVKRTWWEADHIIPVAEGGGECGLENYQTLCLKCHKAKTAEQARRKALARRTAPLFL